jgi:hypothetical protein
MKQLEKGDSLHRIDRIRRIEKRWSQASARIQQSLEAFMGANPRVQPAPAVRHGSDSPPRLERPQVRAELLRQDRLMRLVLGAYGRDMSWIRSVEGQASSHQQDLAQIAEQLARLDLKAAALRDSVVRVLALNAELELQVKQERGRAARLDQARLAALSWSDTLRAELDRKSQALCQARAQLEAGTTASPAASANQQPS